LEIVLPDFLPVTLIWLTLRVEFFLRLGEPLTLEWSS
jgi:hypothetical protein